jgi:hypothetical protein
VLARELAVVMEWALAWVLAKAMVEELAFANMLNCLMK